MTSLLLALTLAAPVSAELEGAPPVVPFVGIREAPQTLQPGWFLMRGYFESSLAAESLFAASASGPQGKPAGLACALEPAKGFSFDELYVTSKPFPAVVSSTVPFVYVPRVTSSARVLVFGRWENEPQSIGSALLSIVTLGRVNLSSAVAAQLSFPSGAGRVTSNKLTVSCRVVGEQSVDAEVEALRTGPIESLDFLLRELALRGEPSAHLRARQAAKPDGEWILGDGHFTSFHVERAKRCGGACVEITLHNDTSVPLVLPTMWGVDAYGVPVFVDAIKVLAPGASRTFKTSAKLSVSGDITSLLRDGEPMSAPAFPLQFKVASRWTQPLPGAVAVRGTVFDFGPADCLGGRVVVRWRAHDYGAPVPEPDELVLADGQRMMMTTHRVAGDVVEGVVRLTGACSPVVGVSGPEGTSTVFEVR